MVDKKHDKNKRKKMDDSKRDPFKDNSPENERHSNNPLFKRITNIHKGLAGRFFEDSDNEGMFGTLEEHYRNSNPNYNMKLHKKIAEAHINNYNMGKMKNKEMEAQKNMPKMSDKDYENLLTLTITAANLNPDSLEKVFQKIETLTKSGELEKREFCEKVDKALKKELFDEITLNEKEQEALKKVKEKFC